MEFWTWTVAEPTKCVDYARRAEASGWDGIGVGDSQNLTGDPYVFIGLAAVNTKTLKFATSVTNPVTRHPSVTASSAFALQRLSCGRMALGIGRGDSSLAYLGRAPARLGWFEKYLEQLQAYLSGAGVPFEGIGIPDEAAPPADRLQLANAPDASVIRWAPDETKVPVEVAATGPRVIGIAARRAERVMLAVGADPKRIAWGMDTAREAARADGRDPATLRFGAYVNVVCHEDPAAGRELGRGPTGLFARFSSMYGQVAGPTDKGQMEVFRRLHDRYDMDAHGHQDGSQTTALTDKFMDSYAIVGPPGYCAERLSELADLGISKFGVVGPDFIATSEEAQSVAWRFADDVLPLLR
jgi:5,10-methylenetetrahydromethanopterin reductase